MHIMTLISLCFTNDPVDRIVVTIVIIRPSVDVADDRLTDIIDNYVHVWHS